MDTQSERAADNVHDREKLWDLIKGIRFAMFTTRHGNGHPHSRPMTTQNTKIDEDTSLWFFMSRRGAVVADPTGRFWETSSGPWLSLMGRPAPLGRAISPPGS